MNCRLFVVATALILAMPFAQLLPPTAVNLLCDGNFEAYKLAPVHSNYVFIASNYSCWYNKIGGPIEIQYRLYPYNTTTICELVHDFQYILCQKFTLLPFKKYQLNFTVYNQDTMTFTTIILLINGVNNFNHTTLNQRNTTKATYQFWTTSAVNQVCFDSVFSSFYLLGPCLDNITLVKLSPDQDFYSIFCDTNIDELNWQVSIDCHFPNSTTIEYYLNLLQKSIKFYADGKKLALTEIIGLSSTSIKFKITPNSFWLNLNNITIQIDGSTNISIPVPQFQFYVDGRPVTVINIANYEKNMMKNMNTVSEAILSTTEKVYAVLKSCVASYFLINIINFWNLSLMYNVLNISTIPAFSKYFLEKLTFVFFNLNNLSEWIEITIPVLKGKLNFDQMKGRQFIEETKNNYAWFGSFGISSNYLQNNFQTLFLILMMAIKILFILLLRKIAFLRKILPRKMKLVRLLMLEIISFQVFMTMSATATLMNLNSIDLKQKFNNFLQICGSFICLLVMALYYLISVKVKIYQKLDKWYRNRKDSNNEQDDHFNLPQIRKKLNRHRNRVGVTELDNIFQFIPIIMVPSLILIAKPCIFLSVSASILLYRCYWFCKNIAKLTLRLDEKVFRVFNMLFWLVLHICYIILLIFQHVIQTENLDEANLQKTYIQIKIIGFVIVFTVIIGGLFEILRFIVQVLKAARKILKIGIEKCHKKFRKQVEIMPKQPQSKQIQKIQQIPKMVEAQLIKTTIIENSPVKKAKTFSNRNHKKMLIAHKDAQLKLKLIMINSPPHQFSNMQQEASSNQI